MNAMRSSSKVVAIVLALAGLAIGGCGNETTGPSSEGTPVPEPDPVTGISGTASIPVGASGDLANTRIAIYASLEDWARDVALQEIAAVGAGASVQFSFSNLPAGNYYLDAWKDVNNDRAFMFPDLYGWHGTDHYPFGQPRPILIADGESLVLDVRMVQMGTPFVALPSSKSEARVD